MGASPPEPPPVPMPVPARLPEPTAPSHLPKREAGEYAVLSLALWIPVEYLTVWSTRMAEWVGYMPWIFVEYALIVGAFALAFYQGGWSETRVLGLMLGVMVGMELLWSNPLLFNPVTLGPALVLLASMWGFLTFIPYWVLRKQVKARRGPVLGCLLWIPLGFVLAIAFA